MSGNECRDGITKSKVDRSSTRARGFLGNSSAHGHVVIPADEAAWSRSACCEAARDTSAGKSTKSLACGRRDVERVLDGTLVSFVNSITKNDQSISVVDAFKGK